MNVGTGTASPPGSDSDSPAVDGRPWRRDRPRRLRTPHGGSPEGCPTQQVRSSIQSSAISRSDRIW